ncbi:MAG: hypothetical protein K6F30_02485 [Lachnospiraceae bacterium]|nr:hypothetical protein [Lachnospiraceae bacterium]
MQLNIASDFAHYMDIKQIIIMLLLAIFTIGLCMGIIFFTSRQMYHRNKNKRSRTEAVRFEILNLTDRLFELIFSSTFILLFVAIYFTIDYFGVVPKYQAFWNTYNGFILLLFILCSIILNSFFDKHLTPLKNLRPGDKASIRLIGMIYMMVIFLYIKFIYEDDNYDSIILYFITLIIGRFVYFDASLESFTEATSRAAKSTPLLLLVLMSSAIMAWYGFSSDYLMRSNGVVLNLFIAHLYLLVVIFIVNRCHLAEKLVDALHIN